MDKRVEAFFHEYEAANSSLDVTRIGNLYAELFLFGGPNGVQAVKKEDFLKVVPKMKAHFGSLGLKRTRLSSVEGTEITSRYLLAKVKWTMTIENSGSENDVEAAATYVLECRGADALRIVFQIDHQDLASVIASRLDGTAAGIGRVVSPGD